MPRHVKGSVADEEVTPLTQPRVEEYLMDEEPLQREHVPEEGSKAGNREPRGLDILSPRREQDAQLARLPHQQQMRAQRNAVQFTDRGAATHGPGGAGPG